MIIIKRLPFTLLEVMVVLFLIGIGAGLTGLKMRDVYNDQRFLTEIRQIVNHIQTAQDLMLIMQKDVTVRITRSGTEPIKYKLTVDSPLPAGREKILEKEYELRSVQRVDFQTQTTLNPEGITLLFFSRGMDMSKGNLIFSKTKELSLQRKDADRDDYQISLAGTPSFIESRRVCSPVQDENIGEELPKEGLYPNAILKELYEKAK